VKPVSKSFTIKGKVLGNTGKPVSGAKVAIRTVNGLQAAVIKTNKEGSYLMSQINPDSYRMYAYTKDWSTEYKIVNLFTKDVDIDFHQGKRKG
jgi:protocatechuate 3,4-dioxygenase beta subunit